MKKQNIPTVEVDGNVILQGEKDSTLVITSVEAAAIETKGNGTGAKVILRRGEIADYYAIMKQVSGFTSNESGSRFGADVRLLKTVKEEIDEQPEILKEPNYKELEKEFQQMRDKDPLKSPYDIIVAWGDKGKEYVEKTKIIKDLLDEYYKMKIEFHFRSHLKSSDLREGSISDAKVGELLTDFWEK